MTNVQFSLSDTCETAHYIIFSSKIRVGPQMGTFTFIFDFCSSFTMYCLLLFTFSSDLKEVTFSNGFTSGYPPRNSKQQHRAFHMSSLFLYATTRKMPAAL